MSTYTGAHERVASMFGSARNYNCYLCIDWTARDWALDPHATDAYKITIDGKGTVRAISDNPFSYLPLCRSCHIRLDRGYASWNELEAEGKANQIPVDPEREARALREFPDILRRIGRGDEADRFEEFLARRYPEALARSTG